MSEDWAMTTPGVEQMLYLMDKAFEGHGEHALLANLKSVMDEDWAWLPPGGERSIAHIVAHVAACKHMYDHYAFGEGVWTWTEPPFSDAALFAPRPKAELIDWLREGQRVLCGHVAALNDDDELTKPRRSNWGAEHETRWLIAKMIEHDLYHGGEINHIRALHQGHDRWAIPHGRSAKLSLST